MGRRPPERTPPAPRIIGLFKRLPYGAYPEMPPIDSREHNPLTSDRGSLAGLDPAGHATNHEWPRTFLPIGEGISHSYTTCRFCGLRYDGDAPQFCSGCGAGL